MHRSCRNWRPPRRTVTALQEAVGPVAMLVLAICGYIKLEPGSVNLNKGLLTRLPAAQWVSFHPDLRPAVPTQVIHCCEVILKWQTTSLNLNDITILCNIWVMLKNMYLIFVVSEHFQSLPAHHYTHSTVTEKWTLRHNSVNSFSSTLSVEFCVPGNLTLDPGLCRRRSWQRTYIKIKITFEHLIRTRTLPLVSPSPTPQPN